MKQWSAQLAADLLPASGTQPDWLRALRHAGAEQFRAHGLPTRKDETWKYTGLGALEQNAAKLPQGPASGEICFATPIVDDEQQIKMLDGCMLDLTCELPAGVSMLALDEAVHSGLNGLQSLLKSLPPSQPKTLSADGFSALNTATLENGLVIHVAAGVDAGRWLLNWSTTLDGTARMLNSRICLLLEAGARLELLEQFESPDDSTNTSNIVVQVELGKGAALQHVRLVQESAEAGLVTRTEVQQQADSRYAYYGFDLGGGLVRHDLHCALLGGAARASLNGAYLLDGNRHVDNHARVDHMAIDGFSEQYFRGVAGGSARAVFNTTVYIHAGADGSEAKQSNANILLSRRAEIDTKPELEIYADEVIASHGATVGQLDEQAVFYLRSRGLSEAQARQLLTTAFCRSVSDKLAAAKMPGAKLPGGKMANGKLAEALAQRMLDVMPQAS